MKTKQSVLALAVASALFAGNALADDHYSFDFLATGYEVTGTFTTSDTLNAVNGYDILGITGSKEDLRVAAGAYGVLTAANPEADSDHQLLAELGLRPQPPCPVRVGST